MGRLPATPDFAEYRRIQLFSRNESDFFVRDSLTAHRFETEHAQHTVKTFMVTEYTPPVRWKIWKKRKNILI